MFTGRHWIEIQVSGRVIAMTANAFKEDEEKCLAAGMNAHLANPLDMEMVKRTICEMVKK